MCTRSPSSSPAPPSQDSRPHLASPPLPSLPSASASHKPLGLHAVGPPWCAKDGTTPVGLAAAYTGLATSTGAASSSAARATRGSGAHVSRGPQNIIGMARERRAGGGSDGGGHTTRRGGVGSVCPAYKGPRMEELYVPAEVLMTQTFRRQPPPLPAPASRAASALA
eukprot:364323-Chlamydomonas_euryale.AAC.20